MASERVKENVVKYVKEKDITFPIVIDNDNSIWNSWGTNVWPTTILIDKNGKPRGKWEGELDWQRRGTYREVEKTIEALRREKGPALKPDNPKG
jgi:peroxiredoxin